MSGGFDYYGASAGGGAEHGPDAALPPPQARSAAVPLGGVLMLLGGLGLVGSAFLPWVKVLFFALAGTDVDWGWLSFAGGVAVVVAAVAELVRSPERRRLAALAPAGALMAVVAAVVVMARLRSVVGDTAAERASLPPSAEDDALGIGAGIGAGIEAFTQGLTEALEPRPGAGLWLTLVAAALSFAGAVVARRG